MNKKKRQFENWKLLSNIYNGLHFTNSQQNGQFNYYWADEDKWNPCIAFEWLFRFCTFDALFWTTFDLWYVKQTNENRLCHSTCEWSDHSDCCLWLTFICQKNDAFQEWNSMKNLLNGLMIVCVCEWCCLFKSEMWLKSLALDAVMRRKMILLTSFILSFFKHFNLMWKISNWI